MRLAVVVLTAALGLIAASARAVEIKLATWNIAWLTLRPAGDPELPRDLVPRSPADLGRLADYARRLDADVAALQEVDGPDAAARVFDPARYAFFFPDERDVQRAGFAVRRGLPTARNEDLAGLDLRPHARFSLRRGTDITVRVGASPLRLLSVHLNAGCREGPLDRPGAECEALARQSDVLAGWVAARRREGVAFAVLGDFNRRMTGATDDLLRALSPPGGPPAMARATEGVSDPCWAGTRGSRPFIDHILLGGGAEGWWVRDSLRVLVYAERDAAEWRARLSDHCPVSVRLHVPG